jgi:hypothetical protein
MTDRFSPSAELLLAGNDLVFEVRELRDVVAGSYLNAATTTCTLKTAAGVNVTGQSWPLTMTYVASSDGVYRATLPYTLGIAASARYTLHLDIDAGAGKRGHWEIPCLCRVRT